MINIKVLLVISILTTFLSSCSDVTEKNISSDSMIKNIVSSTGEIDNNLTNNNINMTKTEVKK
jgi:hypothetical protein